MTAEVEILVAHMKDVVSVPVATVFEQRGSTYCYVKKPGKPELRAVKLGMSNDKFVEVAVGLKAGEEVVLNPRSIQGELQQEAPKQEGVDVQKKFGSGSAPPADADNGKGPGGGQGGPGKSGASRSFDMMQFDKNGDKKLSKDELPAEMTSRWDRMGTSFEKLDRNNDGFLDAAELAELRKLFQPRRGSGQGGPGGAGGPGGPGGFGGPPGMGPPGGGPPGARP
jgi:HlyD family secretion protein